MVLPFLIYSINKILCASQNTDAITLPAHCWVFRHFGRLSSAPVHSADDILVQVYSGESMFHPLSHTDAENHFYLGWTALHTALNPRRVDVLVGCGLTLCFTKQLLILGDQIPSDHRYTNRWLLISLVQGSHNAYQATALLQQYFFLLKSNVWLTLESRFYPLSDHHSNVRLSWNFDT